MDRAVEALQVALAQNPNFAQAHQRLAYIYKHRLKDPEQAAYHRDQAREVRKLARTGAKLRRCTGHGPSAARARRCAAVA